MTKEVIVIGGGLAGCTAARVLSDNNYSIKLYECNEIGGSCSDDYEESKYYEQNHGSHIFHTNNLSVWNFLSRFTEWLPYQHKVKTMINGQLYPMPLNKEFGDKHTKSELLTSSTELTFEELEELDKDFSDFIFDVAFKDYSTKQWGELPDKSVLNRVKAFRTSNEDRYFTDTYQGIPKKGFSEMLINMIDTENIEVISEKFTKDMLDKNKDSLIIFTGSLDDLLDYKFGELPYRTCDFGLLESKCHKVQEAAVINYPTLAYNFTRVHDYSWYIPTGTATQAYEYPRNFDRNFDSETKRYYPINKPENLDLQNTYRTYLKENYPNVYLTGRQALYKYMNMDYVVSDAICLITDYIVTNF